MVDAARYCAGGPFADAKGTAMLDEEMGENLRGAGRVGADKNGERAGIGLGAGPAGLLFDRPLAGQADQHPLFAREDARNLVEYVVAPAAISAQIEDHAAQIEGFFDRLADPAIITRIELIEG